MTGMPQANNNRVYKNYVSGNGENPVEGFPLPGADLLYAQLEEDSGGNCYEQNSPKGEFTTFSTEPDGELPTDGCEP